MELVAISYPLGHIEADTPAFKLLVDHVLHAIFAVIFQAIGWVQWNTLVHLKQVLQLLKDPTGQTRSRCQNLTSFDSKNKISILQMRDWVQWVFPSFCASHGNFLKNISAYWDIIHILYRSPISNAGFRIPTETCIATVTFYLALSEM